MTDRARVTRGLLALLLGVAAATFVGSPADAAGIDDLRINQIQVVGSHNSYHEVASPAESDLRASVIGAEANELMLYDHVPLPEQFETQKVRQIELDVFRDDAGGTYADPLIRQVTGGGPYDPAMAAPGTKVLHVQDVDYRSTCLSLVACLEQVEGWSDANPRHMPIAILLELKDDEVPVSGFPFVVPDLYDAAAMDALDAEIRTVMTPDDMVVPDDVRAGAATLEEGVLSTGWPTLGDSRGKVMFLMDNGGGYRTDYLAGHPNLEDRVMFTNAEPGEADAAFVKVNGSRGNVERIQQLVDDGYVVRTRADADTTEARVGDTSARDAAFESGAQWVSTDYPVASYAEPFGTGYVVEIPGGTVARCNPVNGPDDCVSADIEGSAAPVCDRRITGSYANTDGTDGAVARLYMAVFLRQPDNAGHAYWTDRIKGGGSLRFAARYFTSRAEFRATYGSLSDAQFVDLLYRNVLCRDGETGGVAYWNDRLATGTERAVVTLLFSESAEFKGKTQTA